MKRTLVTRIRCTAFKAVIELLLNLVDKLMPLADDRSDDTDTIAPAAMAAAVEAAAAEVHIRASVTLSGWPEETADALIAAGVTAAAVDRMLVEALRGRVQ